MSQTQALEIIDIPVDRIRPSPFQPRLVFDLEELRGSIIQYGIRDPLKVRKVGDHYEIIDGERRCRIAEQEGMKTIPCLVLEYTDEEADALSWRFNTERKDYSLEERAKHFKKHQEQGMSGIGIGRIHGYSNVQVSKLLSIFRLPEKYQNYLWSGEFAFAKFEYLYEKGLLNGEAFKYLKDTTDIIDEASERRLTQREFENVVNDYIGELGRRQVEEAKKAAVTIEASKNREEGAREALGEPEVTPPKTSEEFEEAAKLLQERAKELKTPEQILEEKLKKVKKTRDNIVGRLESARDLIPVDEYQTQIENLEAVIEKEPDKAVSELKTLDRQVQTAVKEVREKEERKRIEQETRKKVERELLMDEKFLRKAAELAPPPNLENTLKNMKPEVRALILNEKTKLPYNVIVAVSKLEKPELQKKVIQFIQTHGYNEDYALRFIDRAKEGNLVTDVTVINEAEEILRGISGVYETIASWGVNEHMILGSRWNEALRLFDKIEEKIRELRETHFYGKSK